VPASPPPPQFKPGLWARYRQRCMNPTGIGNDVTCKNACQGAMEMWWRVQQHGDAHHQSPAYPASTDKLQGPFPLKGGGQGWVLPRPSGLRTPARIG
jgi:hypothetical protein